MSENNISKSTRGVTLREPRDVRRVVQRITSKAFQEGTELTHAGRISQLMNCWLKAFELERLADIEKRLAILEQAQGRDRDRGRT
jgi:hypothetical protein